jgi:phenylalanyl-tRNA synthetase alpha chain
MATDVTELRARFDADLGAVSTLESCKTVRDRWLGREQGIISAEMKRLRELPPAQRPAFGAAMNELRGHAESELGRALERLQEEARRAAEASARIDVTRPGFPLQIGAEHPIRRLQAEIESIFVALGFEIWDLPEIETEHYNFEALNMPANHPARDSQDTFYLPGGKLLRTHCSSVQVHAMEQRKPPIRAVSTGKVYRRDPFDATHSPMFYQADVLAVDEGITMGDLKGTLLLFLKQVFHPDIRMRLRPGFFPFVEPGAEVDISCIFCDGKGCGKCKGSGWIEILGAGMVHPKVLAMSGVDPARYTGFAWGMGIDRVAILKYGVDNIRLFFENDLRFLAQF